MVRGFTQKVGHWAMLGENKEYATWNIRESLNSP